MRLAFITSTPQNVAGGSGTYVAIRTLKSGLESLGAEVELVTPRRTYSSLTLTRYLFNRGLVGQDWSRFHCVVGFDLDGFRIAGRTGIPHVASLKGVIADEARAERGLARLPLLLQQQWERLHVRAATMVITTSDYSAARIRQFYGIAREPGVVPELIDLSRWRIARRPSERFTVLSVCHLYPRKRIGLLLEAARMLHSRIPGLEVRIVGAGPMAHAEIPGVSWLGQIRFDELQAEYSRADLFCLPSVQEGFGIVFLEAMASGLPIVAARAAAVPEVVPQGVLVEPESAVALASAIESLYHNPSERDRLRQAGLERVRAFDAPRVAARFLEVLQDLGIPASPGLL